MRVLVEVIEPNMIVLSAGRLQDKESQEEQCRAGHSIAGEAYDRK